MKDLSEKDIKHLEATKNDAVSDLGRGATQPIILFWDETEEAPAGCCGKDKMTDMLLGQVLDTLK